LVDLTWDYPNVSCYLTFQRDKLVAIVTSKCFWRFGRWKEFSIQWVKMKLTKTLEVQF